MNTTTDFIAGPLVDMLTRLRDRHLDMTVMQAQALMIIAGNPGITQVELCELLDATDSAISRVIGILGPTGSRNVSGRNLIKSTVDPTDRRKRKLSLTATGRRLLDEMSRDLELITQSIGAAPTAANSEWNIRPN